ncbi:MAG TPA: DUF6132 family protein [Paludibacter sp.]|nr:DUF6132 family protein [Paludibacter sp.]
MKAFLKKHILKLIGIALGSVAGYAYYHFVGCASGTCPITSNPAISTLYGAILGYLLLDLFKKKEHGTN